MEVHIAKTAGFCFGVKRAVDIAFEKAEDGRGRVGTLGPIIHNPQVIARLSSAGVRPVQPGTPEVDEVDTLIIRTHGIPADLSSVLEATGKELIDATCPFVKNAQQYAKLLTEEGYRVLILGDHDHPEVQGILSYAGKDAIVVDSPDSLPAIWGRVGVVVQTTQPIEALKRLLARIVETAKEIKVYNTICNSTAHRLLETEALARKVDVMLVIGGRNSANTKQLARLCKQIGVQTHHIETAEELSPDWFAGKHSVGITAGASTPDWIIQEICNAVRALGK